MLKNIYLAVPGLGCSMQDFSFGMQTLTNPSLK